jgi:hypothetical protein
MNKGATQKEWATFDLALGLTADLLPVVSDDTVPISTLSKMKGLGKTPSVINGSGQAIGFSGWTKHQASTNDIHKWSKEPRYGICLQTRSVRALDIDVTDDAQALAISNTIRKHLGDLPMRYRENSSKVLFLIELPGEYYKRVFKAEHGIVEFLANGQQCIVCGTHTSGVRYEWAGGLPSLIPIVTHEQFEALWTDLTALYATEAAQSSNAPIKHEVLQNAISSDEVAQFLSEHHWVKSGDKDGRLHIRCPFESEHTGDSADSATTYFPANTGGFARGHFDCRHAHCEARTDDEFKAGVGFNDLSFDDYSDDDLRYQPTPTNPLRFNPVQAALFSEGKQAAWLVKSLIPQAELVVMFGASGSGKSFMALDLAAAIATGTAWRGLRTKKGTVVYIAAEGAGGFRNRLRAYALFTGTPLDQLDIFVIAAAPNFLNKKDALDLVAAIVPLRTVLVIVDTWAQTTAGANENSGEDMGLALSHCRGIHKATGATVLLVHHSGKNASMGARGWSGLRAAADAELEVLRSMDDRVMSSTKQKDGEDGAEYGFKLVVVPLGLDEDGDVITSCVVEACEAKGMSTKKTINLGDNEKLLVRVAGELAGLDGSLPDINSVLDAAVSQMEFEGGEGKKDRRKEVLRRAYSRMLVKGILDENEGRIEVV